MFSRPASYPNKYNKKKEEISKDIANELPTASVLDYVFFINRSNFPLSINEVTGDLGKKENTPNSIRYLNDYNFMHNGKIYTFMELILDFSEFNKKNNSPATGLDEALKKFDKNKIIKEFLAYIFIQYQIKTKKEIQLPDIKFLAQTTWFPERGSFVVPDAKPYEFIRPKPELKVIYNLQGKFDPFIDDTKLLTVNLLVEKGYTEHIAAKIYNLVTSKICEYDLKGDLLIAYVYSRFDSLSDGEKSNLHKEFREVYVAITNLFDSYTANKQYNRRAFTLVGGIGQGKKKRTKNG